jgi:hypothetical protein
MPGEHDRAGLGYRVTAGLGDPLLGPGVATVDDQAHPGDDREDGDDHDDEGLTGSTTSLLHVGSSVTVGDDSANQGKIRSMGIWAVVLTVIGPTMLPITGVIADQAY